MKKLIILLILSAVLYGGYTHLSARENTPEEISTVAVLPTKVAIITDIDRCATRKFATKENLNRFTTFANREDVDFAISLGDNIAHRLDDCSETANQDLNFVMSALAEITAPIHYVLGDHDLSTDASSYDLWLEKTGKDEAYYDFIVNDIHIIVLNTVTGGYAMQSCKEDAQCKDLLNEKEQIENEQAVLDPTSVDYKAKEAHRITLDHKITYHNMRADYLTDDIARDHGFLGKKQLLWLVHTLATTDKEKILIFADHPLFAYTTRKKSYEIDGLEHLTQILEDNAGHGKEIIAISGETHTWHKKELNSVTYYAIDQFRSKEGSWAYLEWGDDFSLKKVRDDTIDNEVTNS